MNYVILNNKEVFDKINLKNFKKVGLDDEERVDAVFGYITKEILETIYNEPERRDTILPQSWLLRDAGIFVLLQIDRSILLSEDTKLIKTLFGLLNQERFFTEIRGFHESETYNQITQWVFAYNKKLGFCENFAPMDSADGLNYILQEIEKKIL